MSSLVISRQMYACVRACVLGGGWWVIANIRLKS